MNDRNDENLRELLGEFMNPEQAQTHLEDIERGDEILCEHPAPEPDDMLIANIKAQIALHVLPHKKTAYKWIVYKVAAVAAVVIIFTAVWTNIFNQHRIPEHERLIARGLPTPTAFEWDHYDSTVFNTKLELIENDLQALKYGEEDQEDNSTMTELEYEVIEIAGDFWKG